MAQPQGASVVRLPPPTPPRGVAVLHLRPLIFTVDAFLSPAECAHFVELARPRLRRATVASASSGGSADGDGRQLSAGRTNSSAWLQRPDEVLLDVERRIAALVGLPVNHSEHFQVLPLRRQRAL